MGSLLGFRRRRVDRQFDVPEGGDTDYVYMLNNPTTGEIRECNDPVTLMQYMAYEAAQQVGKPVMFSCMRRQYVNGEKVDG